MYLEVWMLIVMLGVFVLGMRNMHKVGYAEGSRDSAMLTADLTLYALKSQGLIDIVEDINGEEKIVKGLPTDEEFEKMMELARDMVRNEEKDDE